MPPTPLIDSKLVTVTYRDGKTETLTLTALSLRNLYVWMRHYAAKDTPALAALTAGKPIEWIDTLTDESFDRLAAASIALNFQRATDRVKSDPVALAIMAPGLLELETAAKQLMAAQMNGILGNESSLTLARSESAEAIGNASST